MMTLHMKANIRDAFVGKSLTVFVLLFFGLSVLGLTVADGRTLIKAEATAPGDSNYILLVLINNMLRAKTDYEIQISGGVPLPRSMLSGAQERLDIYGIVWTGVLWMKNRERMFESIENAPELADGMRGLITYQGGAYQLVVYEESGIRNISDIEGKRVFLGPQGSTGAAMAELIIRSATGYESGENYDAVNLDWGGGAQAMQDRQIDVFVRPTVVGSDIIAQLAFKSPIRLLDITDKAVSTPELAEILTLPGRSLDVIPANTYSNQVNTNDVRTMGFWQGVAASRSLDPEIAYQITRTFWENLEELQSSAPFLRASNRDNAFNHMTVPLHLGAYRYYQESGFDVPAELVPPEAAN